MKKKNMGKPRYRKSKTKRQKLISVLIPLLLLIGLGVCGYQIGHKLYDYHKSDSYYDKAFEHAIVQGEQGEMLDENIEEEIPVAKDAMQIDWEQFSGTDAVAWLKFNDISYPVYHDDGSEFYLRHLPDGTYATAGSIFLYGENSGDFTDQSSFIYGHNMYNGSMFGKLKKYANTDHVNDKMYLYLPDGTRRVYQLFSVALVPASSDAYTWSFGSEDSFLKWQHKMKERSRMDCPAPVDVSKRFLTLSTCDGSGSTKKRLIMTGQEIAIERAQKPASWYADFAAKLEANKQAAGETIRERQIVLDGLYRKKEKELYDTRRKIQ